MDLNEAEAHIEMQSLILSELVKLLKKDSLLELEERMTSIALGNDDYHQGLVARAYLRQIKSLTTS